MFPHISSVIARDVICFPILQVLRICGLFGYFPIVSPTHLLTYNVNKKTKTKTIIRKKLIRASSKEAPPNSPLMHIPHLL